MAKAGTVTLELDANSVKLIRELQRAQRQTSKSGQSMRKSMNDAFASIRKEALRSTKYIAGIATAAAAAAAAIFRSQGAMLDELAKTSDALGIQQERLQALQLVADLTGTSAGQLSTNLERMQRNIGRVAREGGPAQKALDDIGVSIRDIINLKPDQQLEVLARALADVENQSVKASIAQDLFGRDGVRMLKLMEQLKDNGLTPVVNELEAMGIAFTRLDTAKVERANDELQKAREVSQAMARQFTVGISVSVATLSNMFVESRKGVESISDSVDEMADLFIMRSISIAAAGGRMLEPIKNTLGEMWDAFLELPSWAKESGIVGAMLFGPKGVAAVGIASMAFNDTKVTAEWWRAFRDGDIGFGEWLAADANAARKRLQELNRDFSTFGRNAADATESTDFSIIKALFGNERRQSTDWREWETNMLATYTATRERIKREVEADASIDPPSIVDFDIDDNDFRSLESAIGSVVRSTRTQVEQLTAQINLVKEAVKQGIEQPFIDAGTTADEVLQRLNARMEELTANEETKTFWQNWLEQAHSALTDTNELVSATIQNFSSSFGRAFEEMVLDASSATDALRGMMANVARGVIRAIGEMIAQWLAYQAVQLAVGRTTRAAAAPALVANAQAASIQAGINAFASTAAIPIVGPAMAPGAMSAALGVTQPMAAAVSSLALAGMAHDGIDSVPYEGTWLLDKGERVMTSETSAKLDATLDRLSQQLDGGGMGSANVNFTIPNSDEGIRRVLMDSEDIIVNAMTKFMRRQGREL